MANVQWWIVDSKRAVAEGHPNKKWFITSMPEIILDGWDSNNDVKFLKVKTNARNYIELMLYHSENYTRGLAKWKRGTPIIFDRYQLVSARVHLKHSEGKIYQAQEAETAKALLEMISDLGKRAPKPTNWVTLDELNEMMLEIDELMENLEEYEILDQLGSF